MKKLIFVGLVVLLGTACTSSGGFDGSAHSVGGSTAGMVAKAVDGEISPGFPGNPVEVTPRTPDNGEPSSPIDKTPETPDEDRDGGWNTPTDDAPDWGVKPKNPKPEQPIEDDKNPGDIVDGDWGAPIGRDPRPEAPTEDVDGDWGQERPSDNPPGDDDNGQGGGDGNGGQGGQNGGGSGQGGHGGAQIDDRMERDSSGGIGGGQGNRSSTDNRMERQPERPTAGRPSDNREANRRDRDHSRDRNGNATGRSVDGRGRVEHF